MPPRRMDDPPNAKEEQIEAEVTCYFAQPLARCDDGAVVADAITECPSAEVAIRMAEQMASTPGYIASWAFSRAGYPSIGWFGPSETLRRFGGSI